jgi:hypothetical protein
MRSGHLHWDKDGSTHHYRKPHMVLHFIIDFFASNDYHASKP